SLPIRASSLMSTMLLLLRCRPCLYVHQPSGDGQEETRVGFLPSRASFYSVCCGLFFLQAVSESFGLVFEIIGGIFDLISGVFDFALQVLALAFTFSLLITGGFTSGFFSAAFYLVFCSICFIFNTHEVHLSRLSTTCPVSTLPCENLHCHANPVNCQAIIRQCLVLCDAVTRRNNAYATWVTLVVLSHVLVPSR